MTTPAACGEIELNGTDYTDGAFVSLAPDQEVPIAALPCADYGVVGWEVTGAIQIVGNEVFLNGSGAITAVFGALVPILFDTVPATCGATLIDGVAYADGSSAILINGRNYSIAPAPCPHYELQSFESSPYVAILNSSIAPDGPSTITAVFVPIPYAVTTTVAGPGCGSVTLEGAPVGTGDLFNLTWGNYSLVESPCSTSTFAGFTVSANLSVAAGRLFVNGSGTVLATFLPILPLVSLGGNTGTFVGGTALFYAAVAVPVAATGYSYFWSFGDGSNNTTGAQHDYPRLPVDRDVHGVGRGDGPVPPHRQCDPPGHGRRPAHHQLLREPRDDVHRARGRGAHPGRGRPARLAEGSAALRAGRTGRRRGAVRRAAPVARDLQVAFPGWIRSERTRNVASASAWRTTNVDSRWRLINSRQLSPAR